MTYPKAHRHPCRHCFLHITTKRCNAPCLWAFIFTLFLLSLTPSPLRAQYVAGDTLEAAQYVTINRTFYRGDSIPNMRLHEFYCSPKPVFKNKRKQQQYDRMVRNVRYLYPLARLVRTTLIETHDYLETLPDKKARQQHISRVEKGVKEQYGPLARRLSRSQGRILVKLIDRECGQTSYEMVRAFLGPAKAAFYQVFAGLFGNSLTKHYDPEGDDKEMERIVRQVESGQI